MLILITMITRVGSAYLTLSVTLERYLAVSRPLESNNKRVRGLILLSSLGSLGYNIPR